MKEWHWEIPNHWKRETLGDIASWASGGTPRANEPKYYGGEIPWLVIGDLNDGIVSNAKKTITDIGFRESSAKYVEPGAIMVAMYGSIGKLGIAGFKCTTNQAIAFTSSISEDVESKFLFHYLASVRDLLLAEGKGGAQANISQTVLKETPFCYPAKAEQRRIATKLDQVTAHIDEAKARLDTIPTILKRFRQAVLAAACSGRLTEDWRRESGISIDDDGEDIPGGWRKCPFNDVLQELRNGISRKPEITPGGVPILRISAVRPCRVILSDHRFLPIPTEREFVASLQDGDLLFTRYNGNIEFVGVCGVVRGLGTMNMLYPDKLMRVRLKHDVSPEWVEIFFSSPEVRGAVTACSKSSAGQNGISGVDIKNQPILVPPISEQTEIIRRVEALFKQADAIEASYKKACAFVEKLTPAVLDKAFRGELI